jgi:hypothetical protein
MNGWWALAAGIVIGGIAIGAWFFYQAHKMFRGF